MNTTLIRLILPLCILVLTTVTVWADNATEWQLDRDNDGIQVYTRSVPGYDIIEVQGVTRLSAPVERLVAALSDPALCADWIPSCSEAAIVERDSDTAFTLYRRIKNTFPFKDRDYVLAVRLHREPDTDAVTLTFEDLKSDAPENRCCVRMDRYAGFWKFRPLANGKVEITYRVHLLPGGGLPNSMVNMGVPDLPYDTLTNLKSHLAS